MTDSLLSDKLLDLINETIDELSLKERVPIANMDKARIEDDQDFGYGRQKPIP